MTGDGFGFCGEEGGGDILVEKVPDGDGAFNNNVVTPEFATLGPAAPVFGDSTAAGTGHGIENAEGLDGRESTDGDHLRPQKLVVPANEFGSSSGTLPPHVSPLPPPPPAAPLSSTQPPSTNQPSSPKVATSSNEVSSGSYTLRVTQVRDGSSFPRIP